MRIDLRLKLLQLRFLQQHLLLIDLIDQSLQILCHFIEFMIKITEVHLLMAVQPDRKIPLFHLSESIDQIRQRLIHQPAGNLHKRTDTRNDGNKENKGKKQQILQGSSQFA